MADPKPFDQRQIWPFWKHEELEPLPQTLFDSISPFPVKDTRKRRAVRMSMDEVVAYDKKHGNLPKAWPHHYNKRGTLSPVQDPDYKGYESVTHRKGYSPPGKKIKRWVDPRTQTQIPVPIVGHDPSWWDRNMTTDDPLGTGDTRGLERWYEEGLKKLPIVDLGIDQIEKFDKGWRKAHVNERVLMTGLETLDAATGHMTLMDILSKQSGGPGYTQEWDPGTESYRWNPVSGDDLLDTMGYKVPEEDKKYMGQSGRGWAVDMLADPLIIGGIGRSIGSRALRKTKFSKVFDRLPDAMPKAKAGLALWDDKNVKRWIDETMPARGFRGKRMSVDDKATLEEILRGMNINAPAMDP